MYANKRLNQGYLIYTTVMKDSMEVTVRKEELNNYGRALSELLDDAWRSNGAAVPTILMHDVCVQRPVEGPALVIEYEDRWVFIHPIRKYKEDPRPITPIQKESQDV